MIRSYSYVRVPDSLADDLRAHADFQGAGPVRVTQIVEGDPCQPRGRGEVVEPLSDRVRMRWAAILEGEHIVAWTRGGLGPALKTLARRSTVPVELHLDVDRRLPDSVEVAAYYLVAEALTTRPNTHTRPR